MYLLRQAILVSTLLAALSSAATAFVTLKYGGAEPVWDNDSVTYYINSNGSDDVTMEQLESALGAAFGAWTAVPCATIEFSYGGRRSSDPGNGVYVSFKESNWDPSVGDAAAYAMSWKNWQGEITNAVVVYNGQDLTWTVDASLANSGLRSDIQGVGSHEIGHTLGLDHTRHLDATMFFSSSGNTEMRSLSADDQRGACYLYPATTFTDGQVCDSCTSDSHCAGGGECLNYGTPDYFCGSPCSNDSDCLEGYFCYTEDGIYQCVPDYVNCNDAGNNVPFGGYCWGYEVCESGLVCIPFGGDAYCTRQCTSTCPDGYRCMGGYCLRGSGAGLGESCENDFDCESMECVTVVPGTYVCSEACDGDGDCPGTMRCPAGMCFESGDGEFTDPCSVHWECESAYCAGLTGARFCTYGCAGQPGVCPPGSSCTPSGYCSEPTPGDGSWCRSDDDCPFSYICQRTAEAAPEGACTRVCDPINRTGCVGDQRCAWLTIPWREDELLGECLDPNDGRALGESCVEGVMPCEVDLVCAEREEGYWFCFRNCRTDNGAGCRRGECISLGDEADPLRGYCVEPDPPPPPDIVQGDPDVVAPPPPDGGSQDQGGLPGVDIVGGTDQGAAGTDLGANPNPGTGSGGAAGGSCAAGGAGAGPGLLPLALLLGLFGLRRRARKLV